MVSSERFSDRITSYIISFLISFFLFLVCLCIVFVSTIGNVSFMLSSFERHHYYENIYEEFSEDVEDLAIPSGVEQGIFSQIVTKDMMTDDIRGIIKRAYQVEGFKEFEPDTDKVYTGFYNTILLFATEKGFEISEEITEGIDNVSQVAVDYYESYVELPYIDSICGYAVGFTDKIIIGAVVGTGFLIFLITLVFASLRWRKEGYKLLCVSSISAGLMLIIFPLSIIISGKIKYISIDIKSLYNLFVGYIHSLLFVIIFTGIFIIILGIICACINKKKLKCQ